MKNLLLLSCALLLLAAPSWAQEDADDAFRISRNLYRDAGDYATAAKLFAEFIQNYPTSEHIADARLLLARSYRNSKNCGLAISAYEDFYRKHSDHLEGATARREQAQCLEAEGRYAEAARAHATVQRLFPTGELAVVSLLDAAAASVRGGDPAAGARFYGRVIEEYPTHSRLHEARYRLAKLHFAQGQIDEALRLLAVIAGSEPAPPQAPSALLLSGRIGLFMEDPDRATGSFGQLQRRFPKAAQADSAHLYMASYLYEKERYSEAAKAFETADRRIGAAALKIQARLGLADAQRQSGQPQKALEGYQRLLKQLDSDHANYPRARLGLAIAYGLTDRFTLAANLLQELSQGDPDLPETTASLRELGALYRRRGDYNQAIGWYRRYLDVAVRAADRDRVFFALAQLQTAAGFYEEAIQRYRDLVQQAPALAAEAQFGLAQAFEKSGLPRLALREYTLYLERFPGHSREKAARDRVEYLREYTVLDAASLNRAVRQSIIDELSGRPRQQVLLGLARSLFEHHDMINAVRTFETYAASYPQSPEGPEAQFFLAESLLKLSRQRRLDGQQAASDSLFGLALKEFRILADSKSGHWSQRAQLGQVVAEAGAAPDSLQASALEAGYSRFLAANAGLENPYRGDALLGLADAQRRLGQQQAAKLDTALQTYRLLQAQFPQSPLIADARFGIGVCRARQGGFAAAIDTLGAFLRDFTGHRLAPSALFELGQALMAEGRHREAIGRFQELLLAHPTFPQRRRVQLQLAQIHYDQQDYGRTIALLAGLADTDPDVDGRIRWRLAQAHHRRVEAGQVDHADKALDLYRALAAAPRVIWPDSVHFALAQLLAQTDRPEEAIEQYLLVGERFPERPLAAAGALQAAHLYFDMGQYQKAHAAYQPLLKDAGPKAQAHSAIALYRLDRLDAARKAVSAFQKRFKDQNALWGPRFSLEEGQYHLRRRKYEEALKVFRKLQKAGGDGAVEAGYHAAMTLWEQNRVDPTQEGGARALEALTKFVRAHGGHPRAADVHLLLGNYYFQVARNYLIAAGSYKAVLNGAATPQTREDAIWMLLRSYEKAYEYDEAHRTAERLLREFPNHPKKRDVQLAIGVLLREKGQYAKAIAYLEGILEWAQGDQASEAHFYIGQSYQNMGEYRKAIEAYYRVSYYGGEGSSAWITNADYQRARCHEALEETASAISIYERIVQREGSQSPFGAAAHERVEALRRGYGDHRSTSRSPN